MTSVQQQLNLSDVRYLSRKFLREFIALYKTLPSLWDLKSKLYYDRTRKNADYNILVKKLKEVEPEANRAMVTQKINSMRSARRKEVAKIKQSIAAGGDVHEPKLWYFKLMDFLDGQEIERKKRKVKTETNDEDESSSESPESVQPDGLKNKKMPRCVIINCDSPKISNTQRQEHISYHSFPHDPIIKEKWIAATGRKDWFPTKHSTICSIHFDNTSFIEGKQLRLLKKTACPTIGILKLIDNEDEIDPDTCVEIDVPPDRRQSVSSATTHSESDASPEKVVAFTTHVTPKHKPKRKRTSIDETRQETCEAFGRYVAQKLQVLPFEQRVYLEKIINDAMFEAELGNLNRNCYVCVPPAVDSELIS